MTKVYEDEHHRTLWVILITNYLALYLVTANLTQTNCSVAMTLRSLLKFYHKYVIILRNKLF